MLLQPRPLIPYGFARRIFRQLFFRDEFTTAAAAPLPTPRSSEPGPGSVTADSGISISGGKALIPVSNTLALNPTSTDRAAGIVVVYWADSAFTGHYDLFLRANTQIKVNIGLYFAYGQGYGAVPVGALSALPLARLAFVLTPTKILYFAESKLLWVANDSLSAIAPLIFVSANSVNLAAAAVVRLPGAPFDSDYATAALHTSAVADASYGATANGIFDLLITAPGSLAGSAGLKFRKNGGDYWKVHFDSAGALILQRYASEVAQGSPVTLAGSVISGSAARTLRVVADGTSMDFYTASGNAWTKRGSTQTDSHLSANTGVSPFADASWTSGGGSLGQIDAWARTSTNYDFLETI